MLRQICYKESCFHAKLLHHHRRHKSRSASKTIDVYPQIIVDVPKVTLNQSQLDYLLRTGQLQLRRNSSSIVKFCITYLINTILTYSGPNYIRPNQSYIYSYERQQKQVQQEYENIMDADSLLHRILSVFIICRILQPSLNNFLKHWQLVSMIDIWLPYLI